MDQNGENVINLTNNEVFDLGPAWSPMAACSHLRPNWVETGKSSIWISVLERLLVLPITRGMI